VELWGLWMEPIDKKACSNIPPIAKTKSLASILSVSEKELLDVSNNVDNLWRAGKLLHKKNGDPRPTLDAKPRLKNIHEQIKNRILKQAYYPPYLLGGIEDTLSPRDYKRHADMHSGQAIVFNEDVKDFFPSSSCKVVHDIWQHLFHCTPETATLLTTLTTLNGSLPQGWKTSGYLANLVFWDVEPLLVKNLSGHDFFYSRFMDDITVSSKTRISSSHKTIVVKEIYNMLFSKGYTPKRSKHQIITNRERMEVIGLTVNSNKTSLPKDEQNNIRAAVHKCECHAKDDRTSIAYTTLWNSVSGKVGTLTRFHPGKAKKLREKLRAIKPK